MWNIALLLQNIKINQLNTMQEEVLAKQESLSNLLLLSPTGSGKTLAYLLAAISHINKELKACQVLIIAPTRELVLQIENVNKQLGTGLKISSCYGGHKREIEEQNLIEAPHIIIGTPGRLADHLRRGSIKTQNIQTLILDEYDKNLEFGFEEEVKEIVQQLSALKNTLLVSATAQAQIPPFIPFENAQQLNYIESDEQEKQQLKIEILDCTTETKEERLFQLICHNGDRPSIVFCNHRADVEDLSQYLKSRGIYNEYYHGAMEQRDRETALCKFRNGTSYILITTDIASRGLDIPFIRYIIHYNIAPTLEIFTHRNGRTARMDASGTAIIMIGAQEYAPSYLGEQYEHKTLRAPFNVPDKPQWSTLYISLGKKDKVNKIDVVGFLSQVGQLKKEDIGLIEVKDFCAFVAVRRSRLAKAFELIKGQKIKNKKAKIELAK